jgi:hypothetical protein
MPSNVSRGVGYIHMYVKGFNSRPVSRKKHLYRDHRHRKLTNSVSSTISVSRRNTYTEIIGTGNSPTQYQVQYQSQEETPIHRS